MNKYAVDLDIPFKSPLRSKEQFDAIPRPTIDIRKTWQRSDLDPSELSDEFLSWLDSHGLATITWDIFIQPPQWEMHIHIDQHNVFDNATKLNFAWCDGDSKMCWYEAEEETSLVKGNAGGLYRGWDKQQTKKIYEHTIGTPSLVNAGIPHNVINKNNSPRICVSVPLVKKEDLSSHTEETLRYLQWDDAVKIFAQYIK